MPEDQQSLIPDLESFLLDLATGGPSPEQLQAQALGLHIDDAMARITPITFPTTPAAPAAVVATGFATEIGVAWQFSKLVGGRIFGVEVRRATLVDMSDAVSLGEHHGFFMVDTNADDRFAASTTRYYQVRSIGQSGETIYFSAWTPSTPVSGTTLTAGSTNTDLQQRMDTFAAAIQGLHLYPLAIPSTAFASAISAVGGTASATSDEISINIAVETSNRISADNVLSQAVSVISQQVSIISQKVSSVSVVAADTFALKVGATPQTFRVYINATDYLEFPVMVASTAVIRQVGAGITAIFLGDYPTENAMIGLDAGSQFVNFYTAGSLRWRINPSGHLITADDNIYDIGRPVASALSASPRDLYLTGGVREGNWLASVISSQFLDTSALSVRVDTVSNAVSVLSNQLSVLSQSHSVLSQAHSVLSNRVSANSALAGVNALVWLGV